VTLKARDLIQAAADVYLSRNRRPEVVEYCLRRYELMRSALGVTVDLLQREESDHVGWSENTPLERTLREAILAMTSISLPFDGMMEAPPNVVDLYQTHGRLLDAAAKKLRDRLRALAVEALKSCDPGLAGRRTSTKALIAAGLPEEPYTDDIDNP
jgi:hypothetical protein